MLTDETDDATAAKPEIPDERTFALRKPLTFGNETITEIMLREPVLKQITKFMKDAETKGALTAMTLLIAGVSGQNAAAIETLCARDAKDMREYLTSFL